MYETHPMVQYQLFGVEPPEPSVGCRYVILLSYPTHHPSVEVQQLLNYMFLDPFVRAVEGYTVSYVGYDHTYHEWLYDIGRHIVPSVG